MQVADNFASLKSQGNGAVTLAHSQQDLKNMLKQRELIVKQIAKNINSKRTQMKNMSKQINSIIEKQFKKKTKERPNFGSQHLSDNLRKIRVEVDKVYKMNEQAKEQIRKAKEDYPQEFAKEIESNKAKLLILESQAKKMEKTKSLLINELEINKEELQKIKNNSVINELTSQEKQYEKITKECKNIEKQINLLNSEQLLLNNYFIQMKRIFSKEIVEQKKSPSVNDKELMNLVNTINSLYNERNNLEKESALKIKKLNQKIKEIETSINQNHSKIRACINDLLRASLEARRTQFTHTTSKKNLFGKIKPQKEINPEITPKKQKVINKIYMVQKQQDNTILIGDWNPSGQIYSDRGQIWQTNANKAKKIIFLLSNNQIAGIRTIYSDKNGNLIEGRTLISSDIHSYTELQILIDQITYIQHSTRNTKIYFRFIDQKNNSKQVGTNQGGQIFERISLTQYNIKWIDIQISNLVSGFRILLEEKPIQQKVIEEQQMYQSKVKTERSFSNSTFGTKKVIMKGRSLKKLRDQPIVDHRLMLGKHKMV